MFTTLFKYTFYLTIIVLVFLGILNVYKALTKKKESFLDADSDETRKTPLMKNVAPMTSDPGVDVPSTTTTDLDKLKKVASDLMSTATQLNMMLEHFNATSLYDSEQREVNDESEEVYDQDDYDEDVKNNKLSPKTSNEVQSEYDEGDNEHGDEDDQREHDDDHEEDDDEHENDGELLPYTDSDKIDYVSLQKPLGVKGMLMAEDTFNKQNAKKNKRTKKQLREESMDSDDEDILQENFTCGYDGVTSASCLNCQPL